MPKSAELLKLLKLFVEMKWARWFGVFCLCFLGSQTANAQLIDLYKTRVTVGETSATTRANAAQQGLNQVLVKITGKRDVLKHPNLPDLLARSEKLLQQYRYLTKGNSIQGIELQFDPNALQTEMLALNIPIWSNDRPLVLTWLAVNDGAKSFVGDSLNMPILAPSLLNQAELRGLPLVFPPANTPASPNYAALTKSSDNALMGWSSRYAVQYILFGQITRRGEFAEAQWRLYVANAPAGSVSNLLMQWKTPSRPWTDVVNEGAHLTTDYLAARSNIAQSDLSGEMQTIRTAKILVMGVRNVGAYERLMKYIANIPMAQNVRIAELAPNRITVQLSIAGGNAGLAAALAGTDKLRLIGNTNLNPPEPNQPSSDFAPNPQNTQDSLRADWVE